jgi:hypothetical protein
MNSGSLLLGVMFQVLRENGNKTFREIEITC